MVTFKQFLKETANNIKESIFDDDGFDVSSINRTELKKFINMLETNDISYSLEDDMLIFDETELNSKQRKLMSDIGIG